MASLDDKTLLYLIKKPLSLLLEKINIYEEYTDSINFDLQDIKRLAEIDKQLANIENVIKIVK